jgi:tripartite-type tricarboxylate transporter receptor subunit TctC
MKLPRRQFLQLAASAALLPTVSPIAQAQAYPARPITMISPQGAGSGGDVVARVVVERMGEALGQAIIIENLSGGEGIIGTRRAARATPDGYTIINGINSTHALNGAFYSLPYDVLNDFEPISPLVTIPLVLFARKTMPGQNLNELIAWLKANPNKASAGILTISYRLLNTLFQKEIGTEFTLIPYRGSAPELQDLVAGQIDLCFDSAVTLPLARGGTIKAYALTGDTRFALAPGIPTFAELGLPRLSFSGWSGFFAPKGTPRDIIDRLNAATVEALADPAVRSRLADLGYEVFPRAQQTPEGLRAQQKADIEKWWPIIKEFGIKGE